MALFQNAVPSLKSPKMRERSANLENMLQKREDEGIVHLGKTQICQRVINDGGDDVLGSARMSHSCFNQLHSRKISCGLVIFADPNSLMKCWELLVSSQVTLKASREVAVTRFEPQCSACVMLKRKPVLL